MLVVDKGSLLLTAMRTESFEILNEMSSSHTEIAGMAIETAITA